MILIYITNPDEETANKISKHLVEKKLVACSNIFPINSMYWWKGKIENAKEFVCILKTKDQLWEKVKGEVKNIHPYDCPCIIRIKAEANSEFEDWVKDSTI